MVINHRNCQLVYLIHDCLDQFDNTKFYCLDLAVRDHQVVICCTPNSKLYIFVKIQELKYSQQNQHHFPVKNILCLEHSIVTLPILKSA